MGEIQGARSISDVLAMTFWQWLDKTADGQQVKADGSALKLPCCADHQFI